MYYKLFAIALIVGVAFGPSYPGIKYRLLLLIMYLYPEVPIFKKKCIGMCMGRVVKSFDKANIKSSGYQVVGSVVANNSSFIGI